MNATGRSRAAAGWSSWLSATSLVLAAAALLTLLFGWLGMEWITQQSRKELQTQLEAEVNTSGFALSLWFEDQGRVARSWAAEPGVRQEILTFASLPFVRGWDRDRVLASEELQLLRARLEPVCQEHAYEGFVVLAPDGKQIAGQVDDALGQPLAQRAWETIRRSVERGAVVAPPFLSTPLLTDGPGPQHSQVPTILVAAPVRGDQGEVAAILGFRLSPEHQFTKALESGRPGDTGETYAFDQWGLMLSDSRFNDHLREIGLLPNVPTSRAMLRVEVRDPGGNLREGFQPLQPREALPLTRMAQSAVAGENEVDVEGYRDYRGVPVVGAWRWLPEYGMGVTHEIDVAEAYAPLHTLQRVFAGWLGLLLAALAASTGLHLSGQRAERRRAEVQEALQASEERYALAVRGSTDGLWDWDVTTNAVHFSARFKELLGFDEDEFPHRFESWEVRLHPDDHERTLAAVRAHLEQQTPYDVSYRLVTKAGEFRWFRARGQALWNAAGKPTRMAGSITDITAERRAEERFRLAVEASSTALIMVDRQRRIVLVNTQVERTFGYTRAELQGNTIEMLVPPDVRPRHPELVAAFFANPHPRQMSESPTLCGVRKDGTQFPAEVGLNPIRTEEGPMVLCAVLDVTLRKQAEDALREAKEAAEAANRAKSDFLANMSHEIRTPMNAIMGMTELVLDGPLTSTQHEYLTTVLNSAESLLSIINGILDFSKIEAGKLELERTEFDLREEMGDALKSLGQRAAAKELELTWSVDSEVPNNLIGDPGRLRQIVVNLVGNGIKFTPAGEVVVEVSAEETTAERATLHFLVRDTGIGVPPEKQHRIFDPFEQVDSSTTRQFGGTGLGLTISARLVEAMQGRMWVESLPGQGSRFHFTAVFGIAAGPSRRSSADTRGNLPDMPVLVVDDNATNRRILFETLRSWGLDVQVAESAEQAMELLESGRARGEPLPLILTDVHMPHTDGFMFTQRVRQTPAFSQARVILLTSGGRPGDAARCEQLRVAGRLMKPVKQSELFRAIMQAGAANSQMQPEPTAGETTPALAVRPLRILLAEDGLVNQKLAVGMLERWGHQIAIAANGEEAVQMWEAGVFDVILMDVQMPVMDGLEATREIRRREQARGQHVPIVAVTARAMSGDREKCLEAGVDAYISKPMRQKELDEVLASCCLSTESEG